MDYDEFKKPYATLYASNMFLQQQCREWKFMKYSKLIACLLVAKKNNELLMKNCQVRLIGNTVVPEVIAKKNYTCSR